MTSSRSHPRLVILGSHSEVGSNVSIARALLLIFLASHALLLRLQNSQSKPDGDDPCPHSSSRSSTFETQPGATSWSGPMRMLSRGLWESHAAVRCREHPTHTSRGSNTPPTTRCSAEHRSSPTAVSGPLFPAYKLFPCETLKVSSLTHSNMHKTVQKTFPLQKLQRLLFTKFQNIVHSMSYALQSSQNTCLELPFRF